MPNPRRPSAVGTTLKPPRDPANDPLVAGDGILLSGMEAMHGM
jgi:hypothetical protein